MFRSAHRLGLLAAILVAAVTPVPVTAATAPVPAPFRVATGLEGAPSDESVVLGDRIFWVTHGNSETSSQDSDLWTSDGTPSGTVEFFDPNPGGMGRVGQLLAFGPGLLFTATDDAHGQEVWYSDGTLEGTQMVADLTQDGATHILAAGTGAAYFAADDGLHGYEPYRWTGPGTTPQLLDINTTVRMTSDPDLQPEWRTNWTDSAPDELGMVGDTLFFTADQTIRTGAVDESGDSYVAESGTGRELWKVGSTGSPSLVRDISNTDVWGNPDPLASTDFSPRTGTATMDGSVYFLTDDTDDETGPELWRSNGTTAGTTMVATPALAFIEDHWDFEPVAAGGKLFYRSWQDGWDGLWATDGDGDGQRVSPPGEPGTPETLGNGVVFSLVQPETGRELWHSDGTGSTLLGDLRPGPAGSNPFPLASWGGHVWFGAGTASGRNLFRTDGTPAGTELVHDLPNDQGAVVDGPVVFYGAATLLYFVNSPDNDRNIDNELWVLDPDRVVSEKASTTTLRVPAAVAHGSGTTVTVTVSGQGGPPTGTVTIRDGGTVLATLHLADGIATYRLPSNLGLGRHQLTATYSGSNDFDASTSDSVQVTVKAATKLKGHVPDLTFAAKKKIRVTATLTTTPAIRATGRMTLLVDGRKRVTTRLVARDRNRLILVSRPLGVGRHRLQVTFSKSPNAMDARTGVARIRVVK